MIRAQQPGPVEVASRHATEHQRDANLAMYGLGVEIARPMRYIPGSQECPGMCRSVEQVQIDTQMTWIRLFQAASGESRGQTYHPCMNVIGMVIWIYFKRQSCMRAGVFQHRIVCRFCMGLHVS